MTGRSAPPFNMPPGAADQALHAAILALQGQRPAEAERIAAGVLKFDPSHPVAAGILGRAMMLQGRVAEAIPVLEQAARRGDNSAVEAQFADALVATGRRDEALAPLRLTMARRPAFLPSFVMYARYAAEAGGYADAIAALEWGLTVLPGAWELQNELALQHIKTNERAAARAVLSQALAGMPQHPVLLMTLGQLLYLDGDYAAAADAYRRVLAANPGDASAQKNIGTCHLEMGKREAGEANLQAAVRAAPQLAGHAIATMALSSHGRFFLRFNAAMDFLRGGKA
jgi:tetratricopeptide (TPR) repeat protein